MAVGPGPKSRGHVRSRSAEYGPLEFREAHRKPSGQGIARKPILLPVSEWLSLLGIAAAAETTLLRLALHRSKSGLSTLRLAGQNLWMGEGQRHNGAGEPLGRRGASIGDGDVACGSQCPAVWVQRGTI